MAGLINAKDAVVIKSTLQVPLRFLPAVVLKYVSFILCPLDIMCNASADTYLYTADVKFCLSASRPTQKACVLGLVMPLLLSLSSSLPLLSLHTFLSHLCDQYRWDNTFFAFHIQETTYPHPLLLYCIQLTSASSWPSSSAWIRL